MRSSNNSIASQGRFSVAMIGKMFFGGPEATLDVVRELHQAGRFEKADDLCRRLIGQGKAVAEACSWLGRSAQSRGHGAEAVGFFAKAAEAAPEDVERVIAYAEALVFAGQFERGHENLSRYCANHPDDVTACYRLGLLQQQAGQLGPAMATYAECLRRQPDHIQAASNLGVIYGMSNRQAEALAMFRSCLMMRPDDADSWYNLALTFRGPGIRADALAAARRAVRCGISDPNQTNTLGVLIEEMGQRQEAIALLKGSINSHPDHADTLANIGTFLHSSGQTIEAFDYLGRAHKLKPDEPRFLSNLGVVLMDLGRSLDAVRCLKKAVELDDSAAGAYTTLSAALRALGELNEAAEAQRKALSLKADIHGGHINLGNLYTSQGRIDEAVIEYRLDMADPRSNWQAASNLLLSLNYSSSWSPEEIFREHLAWGEAFERDVACYDDHANSRDPERRLRIGFLSPDFCWHSIAFFLLPLLEKRDRNRVEFYAYSNTSRTDEMTERMKLEFDHWRDVVGLSDDHSAAMIHADRIDILMDLSGHTARNRLGIMIRKPAPIQAEWLGYPNTTGSRRIDYYISDVHTDPPDDSLFTEKLFHLPKGFHCYGIQPGMAEVADLPALQTGLVTFGSFNNAAKMQPATIAVWSQVLKDVPQSRLVLKNSSFRDKGTRERYLALFQEHGIGQDRIEVISWNATMSEHLEFYGEVDIALDSFPYNGTTTTCEALVMGVPVVTLRGRQHASRVGVSLLTQVGLTDWIAEDEADYVAKARHFASDLSALDRLRRSLRQRVLASDLCDSARFSRDMERAWREMWRTWCA